MIDIQPIADYLKCLQESICTQISALDGKTFTSDRWLSTLGTGITRTIDDGNIFEKGGVNYSQVKGTRLPPSATISRPDIANQPFQAVGVSLVFHPRNPFVPSTHMNVRFFTAETSNNTDVWWFGGGYDLTPYYAFEEDCIHWHQTAKNCCDSFDQQLYPELRDWCDRYFFLAHRNEPRGIGGLFFDDFNRWEFDRCFALSRAVGDSFCPAYLPIVTRRYTHDFDQKHTEFQHIRRGRYVEFNLIYDRGTLFGLQSGGRTESILMSLPKHVQWHYNWQADEGSEEAQLTNYFLTRKHWI